jgi:hypothetical protein
VGNILLILVGEVTHSVYRFFEVSNRASSGVNNKSILHTKDQRVEKEVAAQGQKKVLEVKEKAYRGEL